MLGACNVSLSAMEQQDVPAIIQQNMRDIIEQNAGLPIPIQEAGVIETLARDTLSGGLIAPSLAAAFTTFQLENRASHTATDYLEEMFVGTLLIGFPCFMKYIGNKCGITQAHPTHSAYHWCVRYRACYALVVILALLNAKFLVEDCLL